MQDDQKHPLPICANNTIKVPLWLNTAAFPGFTHNITKLEKTIYKNAEKNHRVWNVLVCQDLVLLLLYMVRERRATLLPYWLHWLVFRQT